MSRSTKAPESGQCGEFSAIKRAWSRGRLGLMDRVIGSRSCSALTQGMVFALLMERVDRRTLALPEGVTLTAAEIGAGYMDARSVRSALEALVVSGRIETHGERGHGFSVRVLPLQTPDGNGLDVRSAATTPKDHAPLATDRKPAATSTAKGPDVHSQRAGRPQAVDPGPADHPYRSPPLPHPPHQDPPNPKGNAGQALKDQGQNDPSPPSPAFTLTPPKPVAAKTAPKRAKTNSESQKLTTAPTMHEDATPLPAKASPAAKAPKGRKPPEERSDAKYLRAFDAGIAKGAGIPAFATPPHGLVRQTLIAIAKTHAVKDGAPITGEDLLAWFEARAAAFRKYAADVPDLKFNGGWSPKGLLWWLNGGCLGEPKPPRPPRPIPPAAIDAPDWEMPESAKGKTLEQLIAEVGKPRSLIGPMPEDELQFLREAQARGQAKYKAMREEMAKREAAAEVVS